jgi:EAL domain-containing protein (putative c-di-GMP-specific phosphodiesterase class I)
VELARQLEMEVVAEGVENVVVLNELARLGPGLAQGYYLHRPSNPSEVAGLFRRTLSIDLRETQRTSMEVAL